MKQIFCTQQSLETGSCHAMLGPYGEAPGLVRKQKDGGKSMGRALLWFP